MELEKQRNCFTQCGFSKLKYASIKKEVEWVSHIEPFESATISGYRMKTRRSDQAPLRETESGVIVY